MDLKSLTLCPCKVGTAEEGLVKVPPVTVTPEAKEKAMKVMNTEKVWEKEISGVEVTGKALEKAVVAALNMAVMGLGVVARSVTTPAEGEAAAPPHPSVLSLTRASPCNILQTLILPFCCYLTP